MFSGGRGGGGRVDVKPSSLNICYRRFMLAFLNFKFSYLEFNFIFKQNATKLFGKMGNQSKSAAVNCLKLQDELLTDRIT